jgi:uncharacterized protein (TIGR01244 family)
MRNSHRISVFFILLLAAASTLRGQTAQAGQETAKPPIPNYVELSSRIGTGGQPTEEGMKLLAEKGYKSVINIRSSAEQFDLAGEEKLALQLGLRYYLVPFVAREPSEAQALAFNVLMSALKDNKVFVHCGSGNRVGSLMMIYLALEEGMPADKAEQEAKKVGLRAADLLEFSKRIIGRQKK